MRSRHFVKYILLCCVFLVAYLLRFYALDASSLWSDEGNTWALMARSMGQIARDAAADIHPPGYYWFLRLWTSLVGTSAYALRSASALLGVALVLVTYAVGRQLEVALLVPTSRRVQVSLYGVTAAGIAAVSAFQIYYSQEARMYILLALESATLTWALLALLRAERTAAEASSVPAIWIATAAYGASAAAGLWTHYSFPVVLAAMAMLYLLDWAMQLRHARIHALQTSSRYVALLRFGAVHVLVFLVYAPWIRTAILSVLNWPQGGLRTSALEGMQLTLHMLTFGPLRNVSEQSAFWWVAAGVLPLLGAVVLIRNAWRYREATVALPLAPAIAPLVWLLAPVGLMFGLGLFSDAFLKFLLVASPAWCLLIAAVPWLYRTWTWRFSTLALLAVAMLFLSWRTLPGYYTDPHARDNYAGVARYIESQPAALQPELVVLDAPGQREVWGYYQPDVPVLALPQSRPPDRAETVDALAAAIGDKERIAALFWATDEADPDRIVETWLDQHAFKTLESWQGNLRFVWYQRPGSLHCISYAPPPTFVDQAHDASIQLAAECQEQRPQQIAPGEAAVVGFRWVPLGPLRQRYKVTVQLLDARSQVVAQRDSAPAGGSAPTTTWQPGETVVDNHGVFVPFGTPPGSYRMILALYNEETGERLVLTNREDMNREDDGTATLPLSSLPTSLDLGIVDVLSPVAPASWEIVPIQHRSGARLGPVVLVGYDLYKKGFGHAPDAPLLPGDVLHVTLYWQAPEPLPAAWPADIQFSLRLGDQQVTAPLAGGAYPTSQWQAGALIRGEFDITFDGSGTRPILQVEGGQQRLAPVPQ